MAATVIDVPQPPWTYDLECALFRAIIDFRPIGIHKSLRLISILNTINTKLPSTETPLTLADLKSKLNELYNMEGLEEQEESEEAEEESNKEFEFPYEEVIGIVEDRGQAVDGDGSVPSSPEAVMSVRSGRSGGGRGTKRRREESSAAVSNTEVGSDEEGAFTHARFD